MLNEEVLKRVMSIILNVAVSSITPEASMDNVSSWDSLRHMNLVLALEEEFNVTIPDDDVASMTSYKLICLVLTDCLANFS